jgi:putative tricarboxylic transport membrane protein
VALLALTLVSVAAEGQMIKGLILCGIGLMLAFVGPDPVNGYMRFTFGSLYLQNGIDLMPVVLGLFAMAQAIHLTTQGNESALAVWSAKDRVLTGVREAFRRPTTLVRSGVLGIALGVMPILGTATASIVAYMFEKKRAKVKEREEFGNGSLNGLLAPETAKAACVVGDMIPTLTLGIPGSAATALFLAALVLHGITPGPEFFQKGALSYTVFIGILLAQITFFVVGILTARYWARVIQIPNSLLVPAIAVLCALGAYAPHNEIMDVVTMMVFGVIGYLLSQRGYPVAALLLGLVLGEMVEGNYHRAMIIGDGNPAIFVTEPVSGLLLLVLIVSLASPALSLVLRKIREGRLQTLSPAVAGPQDAKK